MKKLTIYENATEFINKTGESLSGYGFDTKHSKEYLESLGYDFESVVDINILDNISITQQSLGAKDKVFIMPGVSIPRYKIREKGKELGFDIVRSLSKATKVIFNKKQVLDEMVNKKNDMYIKSVHLINLFNHFNLEIPEELTSTDIDDKVFINWNIYRVLRRIENDYSVNNDFDSYHCYTYTFKETVYEELINDLLTGTKVILSDADIIKQCNGSGALNEESYKRLVSMFANYQNQEIALELLCNCDYESSMVYILKLLSKFNFRNMPGTNHINYKSFRNYMVTHWDLDPNYYGGDIMDIVRRLLSKNKLTKEYLNLFKPEILEYLKRYGENDIFKITSIQMVDQYKEKVIE